MKRIYELLPQDHILLELNGRNKNDIISRLVDPLINTGRISDPERLQEELIERENLSSTGIGNGIAMPHRMSETVQGTLMVFGRSTKGLFFDAVDNKPVYLFFLLAGHIESGMEHLRLLSKLSRLLHDGELREQLIQAETPDAVREIFKDKET